MGTPEGKGYRSKDEEPVTVTLTSGFWLGEAEVTQDQWKSVMKTTPWKGKKNVKEGGDYPAVHISHGNAREEKLKRDSATEFCRRLTEQEHKAGRLPAGWMYVLPTEAQWEYGCRAATATKFYFGDDKANLSDYGWWGGLIGDGNAKSEPYAHRVRLKKPNAWGLYDMHGNVNEWCADSYREKLPGGRDPVVVTEGTSWTWRGGCWAGHASNCGSAIRTSAISDDGNDCLGFRVAIVRSSK